MKRREAARVALACLLACACACASRRERPVDGAGVAPPARADSAAPARDGVSGFALTNLTGATLRAVYVSPSESAGWEENVVGAEELADGATVRVGFSPEEKAVSWDVRVVSKDDRFAEWKGLRLRDVSRITLLLDMVGGERVVVAEIE